MRRKKIKYFFKKKRRMVVPQKRRFDFRQSFICQRIEYYFDNLVNHRFWVGRLWSWLHLQSHELVIDPLSIGGNADGRRQTTCHSRDIIFAFFSTILFRICINVVFLSLSLARSFVRWIIFSSYFLHQALFSTSQSYWGKKMADTFEIIHI